MDILRPWLAATIEGELSEALRHGEDGTSGNQSNGASRGLSYDDGSNLRIRSAKKGPIVQIDKFVSFEEPIQVTLSDSVTRINASITNMASQKYAKQNRRKLTEGTVGGLIQLQEFEIVATHIGPRDKRLTLYVKDFKSIGSNGSGQFGFAPQAIESREGTKGLLKTLEDLRKRGWDAHSEQSATASPIRSQPSTQTSEAGVNEESQTGFATQIPRSNISNFTKAKPQSTFATKSAESLAPPTKGKHGTPLASISNPLQVQAARQRPSTSEALLGLLRNHKRAAPAPKVVSEATTKQPPGRPRASTESTLLARDGNTSQHATPKLGDENASRAPTETPKRKRESPVNSPRKKAADGHSLDRIDKACVRSAANHDLDNKARPEAAVTEASINTLPNRPVSPSISASTKTNPKIPLVASIDRHPKLTRSAPGQNTGRKRISSRDVNIPKDQEALLNRADSWLPAEPGQREPTASIPISLLKKLNQEADLPAQRSTISRKQRIGAITSSAVADQTADSESDIPASSGQWPASPERDQLPPDSSSANDEDSDHSIQITKHPLLVSSRRQSHASMSSHSILSERSGPRSASVASSSGGEDVHLFTCRTLGCDKSYKKPSGLKNHMNRHHPDTGFSENFQCPVRHCTKSYASPDDLKRHIQCHDDGIETSPSHSGNATPTTPGSYFPVFPRLTSWSKRDGGSGKRVVDSMAHNDLDGVEVSSSMPPLLDQGSRTSRDKEVLRRRSSTNSILNIEVSSPLLPASPTPESDLEMTVPLALNEKTDSVASSAPTQRFPSTASQPQDPFTQVKRTPYANGGVQDKPLLGFKFLSSPLKANFYPSTNGTMDDSTEFVSASVTSGPDTSAAETQGENGSSSTVEERHVGNMAASFAEKPNSQNVIAGILEEGNELITEAQPELRKAEAAAARLDDSSAEARSRLVLEKLHTTNHIYTDPLLKSDHTVQIAHEMKRKFAESSFESPSVAKRHKRFKVQSNFTLAERSDAPRDPLEGARQIRQDFLASRRSSESSTPTMSPTIPFKFFPGTKSENPRDPSERARQIRQDFLASRRSSETSTPTTSPGLQFTRLPEVLQTEQRSVEVQTTVDKETIQDLSVDTVTEREKVIELSSRSQTQEMESDAAPLPNGTASTKPDSDDAKPGARDNASFDYEADSLKLVLQNAGVKGPDAESSVVTEPSSHPTNDEVQRTQSVELDDFLYSPHHQLDNDLANAKDNLDETLDLGVDLVIANHDQSVTINKDDRAVDPEPDNAREDLPIQAFEVAEQGRRTPTPNLTLSQVGALDTVALQALRSQPLIEENGDARTLDKTASELALEQQSSTVDATTPWLDEAGKELTSQQGLIEVDSLMPYVDVDQAISPWKCIAQRGKPMDRIGSLPFVLPAMAAESNVDNQTRLSRAAVESAVPLSKRRSDPEVGPAEEHQRASRLAVDIIAQQPLFVPQNIFDRFRAAYPTYPGDLKHFAVMCTEIRRLAEANRMVHQSLWDDFIIRHIIEYPQYVRRCAEEAEETAPYETFFDTEIEGLQYQKRVINRRSLDEALAFIATVEQNVEPFDEDEAYVFVEPVEHGFTSRTDPAVKTLDNDHAPANDDRPSELVEIEHTPKSASVTRIVRKPSKSRVNINLNAESVHSETVKNGEPQVEPFKAKSAFEEATSTMIANESSESRVVIDLTEDDLPDERPKSTKERQDTPQSNVPHLINSVSIKPPPLRYRLDSSGSFYQMPYTPPAVRKSHAPLLPQSMRSPPVPGTHSTKCTTKSNGRSLPWVESDHSILQSSPTSNASDFPKPFSNSELREVRTKDSKNVRSQVPAKSTPSSLKQSQRLLNTCHRVIQSNWGIKAHELLEPEYYRGQVLSETMIELLAEIASKVKVDEARNRMKEAIDTRIRDNARRGAGHPSQERKILKSDIEVVRGIVETSSMSTTSPFSLPHTNGAVEKQNEGTPSHWWDDNNSPFKIFARAYASIQPGSNNSFAEANPGQPGNAKKVEEAVTTGDQLKMDITRWKL